MRILLVEDDDLLSRILTDHLTSQRYVVDTASNGLMGLDYAQAAAYDLIVLDVNLPRLNGIQLCQRLREQRYTVPILLLTAKGDSSDKIMGLDAGADDYVVKPCPVEEISARIRALLRRPQVTGMPILTWGNLSLDPVTCEVTGHGQLIALSPKEYGLLELFLRNPQRTFSSSVILEHLWSFEDAPGEETVRSHIKRLRSKLKAAGIDDILDTVYGMGYRLQPAPSPAPGPIEPPQAPSVEPPAPPATTADKARAAAVALWQEFQQPILERVAVLEQAAIALASHQLTGALQQAAAQAAHKLAGSLGMFGFPQGSALGQTLEQEFQTQLQPADLPRLQALITELRQVLQHSPQASVAAPERSLSRQPWLLVDPDPRAARSLQAVGQQHGIQMQVVHQLEAARSQLAEGAFAALLVKGQLTSLEDLADLQQFQNSRGHPVIVLLSHQDDFHSRLAGVRLGGNHILPQSTPPVAIIHTVQSLLPPPDSTPIKVLAVDDDDVILKRLQQGLPAWGIQLTTVSTPDSVWPILEHTQPDLVILDVEMPAVSGIELCQVIRSDRAWSTLPILFLTARREPEVVSQIYQVGADDYVSKPFTDAEIATRIFNRLARNRLIQQAAAASEPNSP
jgi:DNA-binding response OmpR family regulator